MKFVLAHQMRLLRPLEAPELPTMTLRVLKNFVIAAVTLALVGCDKPDLVIESDTVWTGNVIGSSSTSQVEGSDNKTYQLRSGQTCWNFKKATEQGNLRAYAKVRGNRTSGDERTSAPFGSISGCV
jgi:hypothetical protein